MPVMVLDGFGKESSPVDAALKFRINRGGVVSDDPIVGGGQRVLPRFGTLGLAPYERDAFQQTENELRTLRFEKLKEGSDNSLALKVDRRNTQPSPEGRWVNVDTKESREEEQLGKKVRVTNQDEVIKGVNAAAKLNVAQLRALIKTDLTRISEADMLKILHNVGMPLADGLQEMKEFMDQNLDLTEDTSAISGALNSMFAQIESGKRLSTAQADVVNDILKDLLNNAKASNAADQKAIDDLNLSTINLSDISDDDSADEKDDGLPPGFSRVMSSDQLLAVQGKRALFGELKTFLMDRAVSMGVWSSPKRGGNGNIRWNNSQPLIKTSRTGRVSWKNIMDRAKKAETKGTTFDINIYDLKEV